MRALVLGAGGLQGRAAVYDLLERSPFSEIVAVDRDLTGLANLDRLADIKHLTRLQTAVDSPQTLLELMRGGFDVAIDLLPSRYLNTVATAAVAARCNLVNTMYASQLDQGIDLAARAAGVSIMPEAGLDPGIDLVLCALGVAQLDAVEELHSFCGGIPEPSVAAGNPLHYKISWSWEGVLKSYARPARLMRGGKVISIAAADQHDPSNVSSVDFPGVGTLEVIPNGDALSFADLLELGSSLRDTSRGTYRWPGHSAIWHTLAQLGLLDDAPVTGLPGGISPRDFLVHHLGPQLQYAPDEKDLVVMRVVAGGSRGGRRVRHVYDLIDERDPVTGFLAMTRTVGFTASIVAQMVAAGAIRRPGVGTAVRDIPPEPFLEALRTRGITIRSRTEELTNN